MACEAVIREPDLSLASTTIVISASPEIILFLIGKLILRGFVPSGNSDNTPPKIPLQSFSYNKKLLCG